MLVRLAVAQALVALDPVGRLLGLVDAILDGVQPLVDVLICASWGA